MGHIICNYKDNALNLRPAMFARREIQLLSLCDLARGREATTVEGKTYRLQLNELSP